MLTLALLLFGAEDLAELRLLPNTTEIMQRDNLLVNIVLEVKSKSAITIFSFREGGKFRIELREEKGWVPVGTLPGDVLPGGGLLLMGESKFAEFDHLHLRGKRFLFESPGDYQLRAVANMPWGELASKPVTIAVGKRDEADLKKIADPELRLGYLAHGVTNPMARNVLALESVGGNIGRTIEQRRMTRTLALEEPWNGESIAKEKVCGWLSEKMDSVSYEHALVQLGIFYDQKKNWDGVFLVAQALEYDSSHRREFIYQLGLSTKQATPEMP